jgi:hypothetical protein
MVAHVFYFISLTEFIILPVVGYGRQSSSSLTATSTPSMADSGAPAAAAAATKTKHPINHLFDSIASQRSTNNSEHE